MNVNARYINERNRTAYTIALRFGDEEIVKLVLRRPDASMDLSRDAAFYDSLKAITAPFSKFAVLSSKT